MSNPHISPRYDVGTWVGRNFLKKKLLNDPYSGAMSNVP